MVNNILPTLLGIGVGAALVYALVYFKGARAFRAATKSASQIVDEAKRDAKGIVKKAEREASSTYDRKRSEIDQLTRERQSQHDKLNHQIEEKKESLASFEKELRVREEDVLAQNERLKESRAKQDALLKDLTVQLEKTAQLSKEDAEKYLMLSVEKDSRKRAGRMIKELEDQARKVAKQKATEIIISSVQKLSTEVIAQAATSTVALEDDDMKGRIIGKEGRNIRAFEAETGVDVIIDDTPNAVILSAFDPIRREVAKMAMEKLLADGRIHPTRIEELVKQSRDELEQKTIEIGERAIDTIGIQLHPELIRLLGRLHYRTSYGQNMLSHALEAAKIAENMASILGVNDQLAKRGALLHDIGKAIDFEMEGTHDDLGAEVCRKYGESEELLNCIMAHHEDEEPDTVEAIVVCVADAISSVRPGARRESAELFVKRLEQLEKIANEFEGVERVYAIQAGREIRVMVRPEVVGDEAMHKIAADIAKNIEDEVDYPGEVKVSLVRETRAVGIAR